MEVNSDLTYLVLHLFLIENLRLGHTCPLEGLHGAYQTALKLQAVIEQLVFCRWWDRLRCGVFNHHGGHENRLASSVFWNQSQASQGRDLNCNHPSVTPLVLLINLLLFMLYSASKNNKTIFTWVKINIVISFIFAAGHAVGGSCIFRSHFDKRVTKSVL